MSGETVHPDDFDYLWTWRSATDEDLAIRCDEQSAAILRRLVTALGDERQRSEPITADNFVATVRSMERLCSDGSWALSDAILGAAKLLRRGEVAQAIELYQRFLDSCPSAFYRDIARGQIQKLRCQADDS
jgi:hypothetical protein